MEFSCRVGLRTVSGLITKDKNPSLNFKPTSKVENLCSCRWQAGF